MSRYFDKTGFTATARDCQGKWNFGKPGEYFRCAFCGHKFIEGDLVHGIYTNDIPDAPGNPLVCASCYTSHENARQTWKEKWQKYNLPNNWWFNRR
jgi:hypothetical protein